MDLDIRVLGEEVIDRVGLVALTFSQITWIALIPRFKLHVHLCYLCDPREMSFNFARRSHGSR